MPSEIINRYLKRRIMGADGNWHLFCRLCGEYKPETDFYNSKHTPFGKTYKCKIHYQKNTEPNNPEFDYLKLNPITDRDFMETEKVLRILGYKIGPEELPIWRQFEIKHNLNSNKN